MVGHDIEVELILRDLKRKKSKATTFTDKSYTLERIYHEGIHILHTNLEKNFYSTMEP